MAARGPGVGNLCETSVSRLVNLSNELLMVSPLLFCSRPGHEIVERLARFSIKIQDNLKLISDYPSDLPDFRPSEVVRWPAFKCARCHPSASEWTWRSGVQVHVQSECTMKGRTFGAGLTGTAKHRSIPSQWQPGGPHPARYSEAVWVSGSALAKLKLIANQKNLSQSK